MLKFNENKINKDRALICKNIKFYCQKDKEAFLEWVRRLECVHDVVETGDDIVIDLCNGDLDQFEVREFIALFYRYKLDMKELQKLVKPSNRRWFMDREMYWWKPIFGEKGPIIKNGLIFGPLNFFSPEDKELFLDWVQAVRHLESYRLKKNVLYANLYSTPIRIDDLKNLIGIFERYNLSNPEQLKERFGTEDNQYLFDELIERFRGRRI